MKCKTSIRISNSELQINYAVPRGGGDLRVKVYFHACTLKFIFGHFVCVFSLKLPPISHIFACFWQDSMILKCIHFTLKTTHFTQYLNKNSFYTTACECFPPLRMRTVREPIRALLSTGRSCNVCCSNSFYATTFD